MSQVEKSYGLVLGEECEKKKKTKELKKVEEYQYEETCKTSKTRTCTEQGKQSYLLNCHEWYIK